MKFFGDSLPLEQMKWCLRAWHVAQANNKSDTQKAEEQFNRQAEPHNFQPGQLVLLQENYFLHENTELVLKFSGRTG